MLDSSRFQCPSASLMLKSLLKRTRHIAWISLALTMALHLSLTRLGGSAVEERVAKPLTTQFVKRQPRLTKPLELKKRPRPKQRTLKRQMLSARIRADRTRHSSISKIAQSIEHMASPQLRMGRGVSFGYASAEPEALAQSIQSTKTPQSGVDMSLELMDIGALDTGQYQAMVIQDPTDKGNIRGFLHLGEAYPRSVLIAMSADGRQLPGAAAIRALVEAMNEYTLIRTDVTNSYTFDSKELIKTPFILTVATWYSLIQYTQSEITNMGQYVLKGGFVMADVRGPGQGTDRPGVTSMRSFIIAALGAVGVPYQSAWDFEILPNSHPVYHSFFDFENGPPGAVDVLNTNRSGPVPYLEGVQIDNRLLVLLSMKALAAAWGQDSNSAYRGINNTRHLQFGVNVIVFALTQEGSVTNQVMDTVSY